ncbi:MAG: hypothetical protein IPP63_00905 [Chloracidobacterium sp.]|nr:hypothetical protein [Chloracidobacterium sp.]
MGLANGNTPSHNSPKAMNRFLDDKKNNWQRLEDLLSMMSGVGLRGLSRAEVREFGELYRRAAADLALPARKRAIRN